MGWSPKPPDASWVETEMDLCGTSELVNLLDEKIPVPSELKNLPLLFSSLVCY